MKFYVFDNGEVVSSEDYTDKKYGHLGFYRVFEVLDKDKKDKKESDSVRELKPLAKRVEP